MTDFPRGELDVIFPGTGGKGSYSELSRPSNSIPSTLLSRFSLKPFVFVLSMAFYSLGDCKDFGSGPLSSALSKFTPSSRQYSANFFMLTFG